MGAAILWVAAWWMRLPHRRGCHFLFVLGVTQLAACHRCSSGLTKMHGATAGHIAGPLACHIFCNFMGLPDFGSVPRSPHATGASQPHAATCLSHAW